MEGASDRAGNSYTSSSSSASPSASSILTRQLSRISFCDSEDEETSMVPDQQFVPSPLMPLKKQLELDKEDESLQRWKEQLLGGGVQLDQSEEWLEPEVEVVSLRILPKGRTELSVALPLPSSASGDVAFALKEGSTYSLKVGFVVRHNLVCGLTYLNRVWKAGIQVDQTRVMLGTYSPQKEPYVYVMDEETTPAGVGARGVYKAKTKFEDDDGRCYMEAEYSFQIQKDW